MKNDNILAVDALRDMAIVREPNGTVSLKKRGGKFSTPMLCRAIYEDTLERYNFVFVGEKPHIPITPRWIVRQLKGTARVAAKLGVTTRTVERWVERGAIPLAQMKKLGYSTIIVDAPRL